MGSVSWINLSGSSICGGDSLSSEHWGNHVVDEEEWLVQPSEVLGEVKVKSGVNHLEHVEDHWDE